MIVERALVAVPTLEKVSLTGLPILWVLTMALRWGVEGLEEESQGRRLSLTEGRLDLFD